MKSMRVSLSPEEWRKLRAWAAEEATTVEAAIARIVRGALEHRPGMRL